MKDYIYYGRRGFKRDRRFGPAKVLALLLVAAALAELFFLGRKMAGGPDLGPAPPVVEVVAAAPPRPGAPPQAELAKKDLAALLDPAALNLDRSQILTITDQSGHELYVRTTIIPELQNQGETWVKASQAHKAALVILNPVNGEVLTLAGYAAEGEEVAALATSFPAASLFKIVTAAAAVERADYKADSTVAYDGGNHTLYRNNVIKEPDQGRQTVTLKEGFAKSINTVFGKLGAFTLGPEELNDFAGRFGFNQNLDFELPMETSSFKAEAEDDAFHLAELASGFNRSTKVSPLHGALLAAAVVTGGLLPEPSFVREVFDNRNNIYYQAAPAEPKVVISPQAAGEMASLMRSAVEEGTGRRTFGSAADHPVLSRLHIGGKSGTINDEAGRRVDWFVAWARPRPGAGDENLKLAVSAVVLHDALAGTSSQKLVRDALVAYYQSRLNKK
jgi:membrane peptidoglycan carboxypeptidase